MNVYKINDIAELIKDNSYVGRGIIAGKSADGKSAVTAYFIMGRSDNSRNRIFIRDNGGIKILPYDSSKVKDPSLIIYSPVRTFENNLIVTNGDQTDTVYDYLCEGKTFEEALETRQFEPDAPNFTPRISALFSFKDGDFSYKMNILKSENSEGTVCARYNFSYAPINGLGHFIHTYVCDGDPIPSFTGEPERIAIDGGIDEFTEKLWKNLNEANKISLYVRYTSLSDGSFEEKIINKNKPDKCDSCYNF